MHTEKNEEKKQEIVNVKAVGIYYLLRSLHTYKLLITSLPRNLTIYNFRATSYNILNIKYLIIQLEY